METDSQSLDSDEGVELLKDHEDLYPNNFPYLDETETVLEAKTVYLLLPKNVPVSRTERLQWFLDHLNTVIRVPLIEKWNDTSSEIEILSAIARDQSVTKCNRYLINSRTEIIFLAHSYRFVYCLDMSPSQSIVDVQINEILFDEILNSFKTSVEGLAKQFIIPGTSLIFQPKIFLTVMVNTPFFMSPAQQVLVKGVQISTNNLYDIIDFVQEQFHLLEGKIADVTAKVHAQNDSQRIQHEGIVGSLFDLPEPDKKPTKVPMVSPDANFVNMLRYSMLAISLLPENSISHILVITDAVVAMPDSNVMESLLFQLHYDSISVSFIKVGSTFHANASAGYIPFTDLLIFFANSTMGTCLENCPEIQHEPSMLINIYQELFLLWSFHNKCEYRRNYDRTKWRSSNVTFYNHKMPNLLSKRQTDENTNASMLLLLSRRMREGFVIDNINYINGIIEIQLSLQWKSSIYILYKVSSQWPIINKHNTRLEIYVSAPYEFLHDITCVVKKDNKSLYRQAIIERFWIRLSQLTSNDINFAQHLNVFQNSNVWYNLPESVRSGIPVFNLNSPSFECNKLLLSPSSTTCSKFINAWQAICQMDTGNWRKWFHTHKISLILKHDTPLPKYLHLPNSTQRFQVVQCRQAATALYGKLSEWASFVLIDNHTYLKLLYNESNKTPVWFCIVRITSKLPCAVLNIGYLTRTPCKIRYESYETLKRELSALSYMPSPGKTKENLCCVLLQKPLEKILIRYERIPIDFTTVIFPDGTQPPRTSFNNIPSPLTNTLFTTLSRYLYHKRWIWNATHSSNLRLEDNAISRILNTLTKMRLKEGFSFAYSSSGIITMVMELYMEYNISCIVQYVLFPPHHNHHNKINNCDNLSNSSDDDFDIDYDNELQLVTEVWIEPQYGRVKVYDNKRINYMNNKSYYEIADVIKHVDWQCINSLLTLEHLSLMCQEKNHSFSIDTSITFNRLNSSNNKTVNRKNSKNNLLDAPKTPDFEWKWCPITAPRIEHIPFIFNPINILPLCQQTELLFSMFVERKDKYSHEYDCDKSNKILLDNIEDHLHLLNDREITLTKDESDRFTKQVLKRHKDPGNCPIINYKDNKQYQASKWRCFIKGISITHVILTFIPATLDDLKDLVDSDNLNIPNINNSNESVDKISSKDSNYSDVPINTTNSLTLPIYVYDCPLAALVGSYINNNDGPITNKDKYEDHRFKTFDSLQDDCLRLKYDDGNTSDNKNDDIEFNDNKTSAKHHCKTLVLVHSKCFTISLFVALHQKIHVQSVDVQAAMDQCEEIVTEIDITDYIMATCGHIKYNKDDRIDTNSLRQPIPCNELKCLHALIKEKFFKMINVAFIPIPTNQEFYFCRYYSNSKLDKSQTTINNNSNNEDQNSDDELSNAPSDRDFSEYSENYKFPLQRLESTISDVIMNDISPLFLHLVCTMKYNNGELCYTSVRLLPTCLGELTDNKDISQFIEKKKLQITLDILCLTLPSDVQNVISEYSSQGLRTTSFCSDGFQTSISSTVSEISFTGEIPEPLISLPDYQRKSIILLCEEIRWLLKDEIVTSLLDNDTITINNLNFVMKHVAESKGRSSCILDVIALNFVFGPNQSHHKFIEEFAKIQIPDYKLIREDELYYIAKDINLDYKWNNYVEFRKMNDFDFYDGISQSDTSSIEESVVGTDPTGYDEDVSNDDDDYDWLIHLNNKRQYLPNFWLILKINPDTVTVYFHCRFLELDTSYVENYLQIQRLVSDEIRALCKRVNQSLLLQSLYETKTCDPLLEPDDNMKEWRTNNSSSPVSRNSSYSRLRSMDETSDETELMTSSVALSEVSMNFKPGYFRCPVVWQTNFVLHPRLKTGPGKSGISRGILALKNILDKFSVSNRTNMFVYRDNKSNVFYLRLYENVHNLSNKATQLRANEYENAIVSRSPSIASLPSGQKSQLNHIEQCMNSSIMNDIRPRVRSFGEKESKDSPNEDTLILKVHGITEAGTDVQCDLVQVLQNRLDDAVLEFLSVMLARNAMCPLSPEDVHFIQKPFRLPEVVVKLTMQDFVYQYMDSFIYYLKQNLLQFLNIPKYTDNRSHYHFKDYSESDQAINRNTDDNIFLYNQSQNPSAGSRGIACIALAVVQNYDIPHIDDVKKKFDEIIENRTYTNVLKSTVLDDANNKLPPVHLEFRLWKQGRVNIDNLSIKLREAISQATWDIIMEYKILIPPLCESNNYNTLNNTEPMKINDLNLNKEIEFNCLLDVVRRDNIKWQNKRKLEPFYLPRKHPRRVINPPTLKATRSITFDDYEKDKDNYMNRQPNTKPTIKLNNYETGDDGILSINYSKYLPIWLEFGSMLMAPSVRKQKIVLTNNHITNTTIKELLNFIQETPKAFVSLPTEHINNENNEIFIPYDPKRYNQKCVIILRNFENWKASTLYHNSNEYSNLIHSQNLKHTQKFVPTVLHNKFIPRQKILWILVQNDSMIIYAYNWARDNIDKLITNCTKLGQWLSVRSCFLNSVISQKLGLFHNQAITQKSFLTSNNSYTSVIGVTLSMMEFPRDDNRKILINTSNLSSILEAFRDSFHPLKYAIHDPVIVFTVEMTEMKSAEKTFRDDIKKLHSMYQSRTSTTTVSQIHLLMKNSRIVHYCHTPLLFLPTWRLKAASTRGPIDPTRCYNNKNNMNYNLEKDSWHTELCYNFFCEYRRYLQTLGFMPLQIDNSNRKIGIWARDNSSLNSIFYIQKTIMGGILLFTVEFNEPFFTSILHAIECNRLQTTSRASINQFTLCFLDECDRVKLLMHLHSFTYDYHLRTIFNYVTTPANKNCDRYNINQFFDDFMKYYNKAPNFARNLIHSDTITIKNMITEGKQLYDYLLTNIGQYNFNYKISDGEIDYILIKLSNNSHNSYKDSQDKEQQIDDFDIILLLYNLSSMYQSADNVLHLKYYLILISKSEIYPKCEIEHHKLGKFRTVSSTARSISTTDKNSSDTELNITKSVEIEQSGSTTSTDEIPSDSSEKQQKDDKNQSDNNNQQQQYIEISSESVNYLGYFSPHEQTMEQIILDKAKILEKRIRETVNKGMVHCRTHLLWNKLVSQDSETLTYDEFIELKNLAKLEHLCDIHPNLRPLLDQPISWYQGLAKLLLTKYSDHNRSFISTDGNIIHYVILHSRYFGAFMLLSLDLHTSRGDLYAVYREPQENEELSIAYRKSLLDGFVNCVCFYLWQGMI